MEFSPTDSHKKDLQIPSCKSAAKQKASFKSGFRMNMAGLAENTGENYFSAQPKLLNLDAIHDMDDRPTPLSFKRNGDNINDKHDRMNIPDEDKGGKYFGASIRMGPHMSVQEDRVSFFQNNFPNFIFYSSLLSKRNSKVLI